MSHAANIGNLLTATAERRGEEVGLVHGSASWTWRQLETSANALAAALLEMGIGRGDRVAIQAPNSRAFYEAMYAITRTGGVYVPVNPRASARETLQMIELCDARVLLVSGEHLASAAEAAARSAQPLHIVVLDEATAPPSAAGRWHRHAELVARHAGAGTVRADIDRDDICWHSFTSGTTGVPKGGLNSHGGIGFSIMNRVAEVTPGLGPADRLLAVAWIGHGTGTMTTASTMVGCPIVIAPSDHFEPGETWDLIEKHRITAMFTVPTILMRLVKHERATRTDRSSLAHVVVVGAAISAAELEQAISLLGDGLVQYYGAVEAVGAGTVARPARLAPDVRHSIGHPRFGSDLMIAGEDMRAVPTGEVGEICLRGQGVFRGYYKDAAATDAVFRDGWYLSGDLGYRDGAGRIFIAGRKKEMFKSGGLQVYPNEIQNHLAEHPAVDEVHVLSLPDSDLGEIGIAIATLAKGGAAGEADLLRHLSERLARYKLPRRIFIVDAVPRSANGKVPKALLKTMLIDRGLIVEGRDVPRGPPVARPPAAGASSARP